MVLCGVVIFDVVGCVFFVYVMDIMYWDILKGQGELGEMLVDVVLCELWEEIGIVFVLVWLFDFGCFVYWYDKDLYLFVVQVVDGEIDFVYCMCMLLFLSCCDGLMIFEMDVYCWIVLGDIDIYVSCSFVWLFCMKLLLVDLYWWLLGV